MAGHYLRKRLRIAGFACRAAGFALILLVVSILIFRLGGVGFETLAALLGLVAGLAMLAFLMAFAGLVRVWRSGHGGGAAAVAAVLIAGVVAAPYALAGALALRNPPTNMAETDGIAEEDEGDAPVADPASGADEEALSGRVYAARASQIYQAVRLVLGDNGWTVAGVETADPQDGDASADQDLAGDVPPAVTGSVPVPTPRNLPGEETTEEERTPELLDQPESGEYRITAVAESPVFALPSDVEIRIVEDDAQGYLDLKSVSRFGARDFGQNRRFIEDFLARVDAAMVGTVSPASG